MLLVDDLDDHVRCGPKGGDENGKERAAQLLEAVVGAELAEGEGNEEEEAKTANSDHCVLPRRAACLVRPPQGAAEAAHTLQNSSPKGSHSRCKWLSSYKLAAPRKGFYLATFF